MKMTIHEIAKSAKVSIATISRALNPKTRYKVKPATLDKIDTLVNQMKFSPNIAARNLRSSSYQMMGVLIPHIPGVFFNDYYIKLLSGVSDVVLESDYHFKLVMLKERNDKWDAYPFRISEGVDGLIVSHWPVFFSHPSALKNLQLPIVVINDPEASARVHSVSCDNEMGGRMAAQYLYQRGHREFVVVKGPSWSSDSRQRLKGFQEFLTEKNQGLSNECLLSGEFSEEKAYEIFCRFLDRPHQSFSAVFCLNDAMAFGVIRALKNHQLKCPQDVSVMGFDDESRAAQFDPALTTIQQGVYDLAKKGTELLLKLMADQDVSSRPIELVLPVRLIERQSVRNLSA